MVGVPVLGLLGILEAGRGIGAPVSVGGEWKLQSSSSASCAPAPAGLSISQSGTGVLLTLNDGRIIEGTVRGATLSGKSLAATIGGNAAARTLEGTMSFDGCLPMAFRAVRQPPKRAD